MGAPWLGSVRRDEIAGIPAFVADVPGRAQAAIFFRVGWADETLPTHGLTHLVEHLAAGGFGPRAPISAAVRPCVTMFYAEGAPEVVGEALREMTAHLRALPVERLAAETRILRVEAGDPGSADARGTLLGKRFGARGPGLIAFEQHGLHGATPAAVQAHADRWFTRGNAALAATTSIPGLEDLELAEGPRRPTPSCPPLAFERLPARAPVQDAPLLAGGTGEKGPALALLATMLERWAWRELRQQRGLAYDARCERTMVGPWQRTLHLVTDATGDDAVHGAELVLGAIAAWADGAIDPEELGAARADLLGRLDQDPMLALSELARTALVDDDDTSLGQRRQGLCDIRPEDVAAVAEQLHDSLIVTVPADARELALPLLQVVERAPVEGRRYAVKLPADHDDAGEELIVGSEGVTLTGTPPMTVRYDECVAAVRTLDGGLELVGPSGAWILLDPQYLRDGTQALLDVTAALEPSLLVDRRPPTEVARIGPALAEHTVQAGSEDASRPSPPFSPPPGTIPGIWPERR